jgi:hypothetical protein
LKSAQPRICQLFTLHCYPTNVQRRLSFNEPFVPWHPNRSFALIMHITCHETESVFNDMSMAEGGYEHSVSNHSQIADVLLFSVPSVRPGDEQQDMRSGRRLGHPRLCQRLTATRTNSTSDSLQAPELFGHCGSQ